jgi:hypothetical protein
MEDNDTSQQAEQQQSFHNDDAAVADVRSFTKVLSRM